jgi:hypothetical protein
MSSESTEPLTAAPTKRTPKGRKKRSTRGHGRVFQRGHHWWIAFYAPEPLGDGTARSVERRERGGATEAEARELLVQRLAERNSGTLISRQDRRLTVSDALEAWHRKLELREAKSARQMTTHIAIINRYLGTRLASEITRDEADRWIQHMIEVDKYSKGSAVMRAGLLRAALRLAFRDGRLQRPPVIELFNPKNARKGFLEPAEVDALTSHMT